LNLPFSERFLLRKALILRRISSVRSLPIDVLLRSLVADEELVRTKTPQFYFQDDWLDFRVEIDECVDDGLIEWTIPAGSGTTLKRTRLGDQFLKTLEPRLQDGMDDMPMSGDGVLDFLATM
jgi:hypothetical protein